VVGTLSAHGTQSGQIANGVELVGFDWSVESPRDAATGQATGKRLHKPFVITIEADPASVLLLGAIFTNERLDTVEIALRHVGEAADYMRVSLTNAFVGLVHRFSDGGLDYEEITFVYERIQVMWLDPPITVQDDWAAPTT
jgi:type VI secretion system secreted protein Hcp